MVTIDRKTVLQVIGGLMSNPSLLNDTDKYQIEPNEFPQQMDKYIFTAIYNLYVGGANNIHTIDISTYLDTNELAKRVMEEENGLEFLQDCENYCEPENFNFYYKRFKKLNLLKDLQLKYGKDISKFYCDDPLNPNYSEINERFEKTTANEIINQLKGEIASLETKYTTNTVVEEMKANKDIKELLEELKVKPEVGVPLQGDMFNTITRGGRKKRLYLRSASSGTGKTRTMVGDACNLAYPIHYDNKTESWVSTGICEKILYVMTEQDLNEIQTMILAYLTGINEDVFRYSSFTSEQLERVGKALEIMNTYEGNFYCARVPDPSSSVVKNLFRRYSMQQGVENFFYDYIFSSPAMLEEYRDLAIREDVCLRLFTTTLKNLAVELNAFILTSTQISNDDDNKHGGFRDYHNIRGSRAIVDLVDFACIMSRPSPEELSLVEGFQKMYHFNPNIVTDIFKNRGGRWTMVRIWSLIDLGTLRRYDLFVTDARNEPIEEFQIVDFNFEKTEEMEALEEYYNDGIVSNEVEKELNRQNKIIVSTKPELLDESLMDNINKAFGDLNDERKRIEDCDFDDLL